MKNDAVHRTQCQVGCPAPAFTLIELLVVIAVMALLMAMAGLSVPGSMATQQLGGMARQLAADLDHAVLVAQKESQPVEVRFYRYLDKDGLGGEQYRAYQVARMSGWNSDGTPKLQFITEPQRLTGGVIFMPGEDHFSLARSTPRSKGAGDPDLGVEYQYVSYLVRPDGRTNLPRDSRAVFTLVHETTSGAPSNLPADYRAVVVDPVNGAVTLF